MMKLRCVVEHKGGITEWKEVGLLGCVRVGELTFACLNSLKRKLQ